MNKEVLVKQLRDELKEDIIRRYNTPEYWDAEIIESFIQENQLTEEEAKELIEEVNKEVK
jgi:hypothetical protein